ncbi:MAG: MaoC family dehydratase [Acidobacteria bacterium]|nr:MaoC family dehydratase [Acidobacteriota bacterium]MBK9529710.1 MaoC family dehydratase [Acidobacteriota bacterium]MBP7475504.1 MaoC family dehydratase [Pyrinomonadaceae bacterium]MBP9108410.1 MaoC family dehydratase [Pyrinomonadaceae bacterium]
MDLKIGDSFSTTREITDDVIRKFANVSGDFNPIHLDEEFAAKTRFGKRIAHGMLSGAFISAVLGNEFREISTIYLSQTMKFTAPVFLGDTVTTTATITNVRDDKPIITVETVCTNQNGETTLKGEAVVMVLPQT